MKHTHFTALLTMSLLAGVAWPKSSMANMVDYGSLQSLFGEPVTTSATGTPQQVHDVPADMTIITADEIRQSGMRNIAQIVGLYVPGMEVLQGSSTSFDVGVRGYQQPFQPRLLVLVDGRQVFIDDYSRTIWENIPVNINDIRQIEVVKGASSALFGSNAAGGVINIVTYSPIYDHNNVASISGGTQQTLSGDATVTKNGSWGGTKFTAGGMTANEFNTQRVAGSDDMPPSSPRHTYFVNSTVVKLTSDIQANSEVTHSDSHANGIDTIANTIDNYQTTTYSARVGLDWQSPYGLITNTNYFNHSYWQIWDVGDSGVPNELTVAMFASQLQDQFKIDNDHTIRVGVEYRHKDFTNLGSSLILQSPDLREDNIAASGMWLWQINEKISWTNALRYDRQSMDQAGTLADGVSTPAAGYSQYTDAWSGNSALVYEATEQDTFRLGYGRGVQLPSLIQSGYNQISMFEGVRIDAEGNPNLKPTIVQDITFSYNRKVAQIYSFLTLSTFYENNQDIVAPLISHGNRTIQGNSYSWSKSENVGASHGFGQEIQIKGTCDGFRWNGSYSFAKVIDSQAVETKVSYQGSSPEHHFRLLLGYSIGSWEFDANGQYVTADKLMRGSVAGLVENAVTTNAYGSLGGRIGYAIDERFTLALSGTNINRGQTPTSPFPAVEHQAFLTLTGHF